MSREMLESAYRGALDRQMLQALDEPWACDANLHGTSNAFHEGNATHLVECECEHYTGFRCARNVAHTGDWVSAERRKGNVGFKCEHCGTVTQFNDIRITPLGVRS